MAGLLRGVRAKISRADECANNLSAEINRFLTSDPTPYAISKALQENATEYVFHVELRRQVPDRFAVLAGEVVHHLASSLDHLFAALVVRAGNTIERHHYFPICTSTEAFRRACEQGAMDDISPAAQRLIESVQPCHTPTPRDTILAAVKELNNTDKHRLLLVLATAGSVGSTISIGRQGTEIRDINGGLPSIVALGSPELVQLTNGRVEFFRIGLGTPTPQFEAETDFAAQIAFAQCGLAKLVPLTSVLPAMIAGVSHTISLFRAEFDDDD